MLIKLFKKTSVLSIMLGLSGCGSVFITSSFQLTNQPASEDVVLEARALVRRVSERFSGSCPAKSIPLSKSYKCTFGDETEVTEISVFETQSGDGLRISIRSATMGWLPQSKKSVRNKLPKDQAEMEALILDSTEPIMAQRRYNGFDLVEKIGGHP